MFFFYDIDTIHNSLPSQRQKEGIFSHKSFWLLEGDNSSVVKDNPYNLTTLLKWFDPLQWQDYLSLYTLFCQFSSYRCSTIQTEFSDDNYKEYYYALVALVTIEELEQRLIISGKFDISVVIKKEKNKKRWYATKDIIVINTTELSDQDFFEVLVHELWHTVDLKILQWTQKELDKKFTEFWDPSFSLDDPSFQYYALSRESEGIKKPLSNITDFCSIYGSKNPFEDFSECFNLYINHHDYFISLTQNNPILLQKYQFIQAWIRQGNQYKNNSHNYSPDSSHRYRDSTKIAISKLNITEL